MTSQLPWLWTLAWLLFCVLWAARSLVVRKGQRYAQGKKPVDTNLRYKIISNLVFVLQMTLQPFLFWSDSKIFFKFHHSDELRILGLALCFLGLALSVSALRYLGRNYSPCYDSHEPYHLVTDGPYQWIRHPGWLSKWMVGFGGILVSGSWWFVPVLFWIYLEMKRTIQIEEAHLAHAFPEYATYQKRTFFMIPFLY
jgi:protein-S-isoprenylcysteine O-methyltransferase Ste14